MRCGWNNFGSCPLSRKKQYCRSGYEAITVTPSLSRGFQPSYTLISIMAATQQMDVDYSHFDARAYLDYYYSELSSFSDVLAEYARFFSRFSANSLSVLNVGGGPSLLLPIYMAEKIREYVHSDYVKSNRDEVEKWACADPTAFSWREHVRQCLRLEGRDVSEEGIATREKRMRSVFKASVACDIFEEQVVPPESTGPYDYVICTCVLDVLCTSVASLATSVRRLAALVREGGYLHIEMGYDTEELSSSANYRVGDFVYKKLKGVRLPTILETIRAAGLSVEHQFSFTEEYDNVTAYKDQIIMIIGRKIAVEK